MVFNHGSHHPGAEVSDNLSSLIVALQLLKVFRPNCDSAEIVSFSIASAGTHNDVGSISVSFPFRAKLIPAGHWRVYFEVRS